MRVSVDGTSLWFDVDGPALVADGPAMRERPTVVLLLVLGRLSAQAEHYGAKPLECGVMVSEGA